MKLRKKDKPEITGYSDDFNEHSLNEIIVYFEDGDASSEYIRDYEVFLEKTSEWKDMNTAFDNRDLIPNNYNTAFSEPKTEEDRERGYYL